MASPAAVRDDFPPKRIRAKRACRECNARRVRCNVTEVRPCYNCTTSQVTCEMVPSRRGKYNRVQGKSPSKASGTSDKSKSGEQPLVSTTRGSQPSEEPPNAMHPSLRVVGSSQAENESSDPSTCETLVIQDTERTLFFGESNFLTCVTGPGVGLPQAASPNAQTSRMCYPISDAINVRTSEYLAATGSPIKADYLLNEGAFTFAESQDCLIVLRAYFEWFHPCFPILDRFEISKRYSLGQISPLLFQAILFIGASYCDEDTVHRMGFKDRPDAKNQLYNRAKVLYDSDWESNKVTILQSLFLISFWRAGPLNVKNTRYWLGAAISLAQTHGFHRSPQSQRMDKRQARLRRRIWWSIYVRDRQSSASLGLPSRIRDEDCDIEMLSHSDLEEEIDAPSPIDLGSTKPEHIIYVVQMARVAKLLGMIVRTQFAPSDTYCGSDERAELVAQLDELKSELPEEMRSCGTESQSGTIWTYLLHLAYNHLYILLYRSAFLGPHSDGDSREGEPALRAACRVARIVEDMLSQDLIQFGQMHLVTSLFASLCIHTINLQRSKNIARRLAEHRAQICLLGLKEIQKYWEVNNLVLELFFQYLDESTAGSLRSVEIEDLSGSISNSSGPDVARSSRNCPAPKSLSPQSAVSAIVNVGGIDRVLTSQPPGSLPIEDPLLFNVPQNILSQFNSNEDYDSFLDLSMPIHNGLNMESLDFLQSCL